MTLQHPCYSAVCPFSCLCELPEGQLTENSRFRSVHVNVSDKHKRSLSQCPQEFGEETETQWYTLFTDGGGCLAYELMPHKPVKFGPTYIYIEEKAMAPHSSTLAWKIPWTEEPGRLQSMGSLRVRHD